MRKRLMVILAVAVVAGLIPVAATARPPVPPPSWPACQFDGAGTLQNYDGGNYNCMWNAGAGSQWKITVTPGGAAVSITLAVKDNQTSVGGDLCPVSATYPPADQLAGWKPEWSRGTHPVSATYVLPGGNGDCVDPYGGSVEPGLADVFTLFVDTVPGRNPVSVTVERIGEPA